MKNIIIGLTAVIITCVLVMMTVNALDDDFINQYVKAYNSNHSNKIVYAKIAENKNDCLTGEEFNNEYGLCFKREN